jgi:predicted DNA-binding protein
MYSERLQILLSPEQRRRLDLAAKAEGKSKGQLIREAIDDRIGRGRRTREERVAAAQRIREMRLPGPAPSPEELDRMYEDSILDRFRKAGIDVD